MAAGAVQMKVISENEVGSWQYCATCDVEYGTIKPRMQRGNQETACHCGKMRSIVKVYMCINEDCVRGQRKGKKMEQEEVSYPACNICNGTLVEDTTYRILPA